MFTAVDNLLKILLVEDKKNDFLRIKELLKNSTIENYSIEQAESFREGREKISEKRHDIYLIDDQLDHENGLLLIKEAVENGNSGPFIMLTVLNKHDIDIAAVEAFASDYLIKNRLTSDLLERSIRYALEKSRIAAELKEKENHLTAMLEGISDAFFSLDKRMEIIYFNKAAEIHLHKNKKDVVGKKFYDVFPELRHSCFDQFYKTAAEEKQTVFFESYFDISPYENWYDVRISPYDKGVSVYFRVTTESKLARETIKESRKRYRDLYDNAPDMLASYDLDTFHILQANKTLASKLGYEKKELIGKSVLELYDETCLKQAEEAYKLLKKNGSVTNAELRLKRKDGKIVDVMLNDIAVENNNGDFLFSRSSWRDITDLKQAVKEKEELELRFRRAGKMEALGTLTGGIAHDFNNILGIIIGNAELALEDIPQWNPAKQSLNEIKTASLRAKGVVRQLLTFSTKPKLNKMNVDLCSVIKESLKMIRSYLPPNIELRKNIPSEEHVVSININDIHQLLINLCTNAAHAMEKDGGVLTISLKEISLNKNSFEMYSNLPPGRYAQLTVEDTGCGMNAATIERIFDPYFTTKEVGKGSGMGLSVVLGIVKNHDGAVSVKSEIDRGSFFQIFFPLVDENSREDPCKELPKGNERILYVDDEAPLVEAHRLLLKKLGYDIVMHTDPEKAINDFKSDRAGFDVVITDFSMPKMTGDKLAYEIQKIKPETPIILTTGFSEKLTGRSFNNMGISAFLMKPLMAKELAKTLRSVLDGESKKK